jgi:hypothetical protein
MAGAPEYLTTTTNSTTLVEGSSSASPRPPDTHVSFQESLSPCFSTTSPVSYSTRLHTLRALERNWRHLSFPGPSHRVRVPFRTTYVYELSGGYFILGSDRTTPTLSPHHPRHPHHPQAANRVQVHETGDSWVSTDAMNKTVQLNFLRLPHLLRDPEPDPDPDPTTGSKGKDVRVEDERNKLAWTHLPLPFAIADFGIDASQDLLVLMQRHRYSPLLEFIY